MAIQNPVKGEILISVGVRTQEAHAKLEELKQRIQQFQAQIGKLSVAGHRNFADIIGLSQHRVADSANIIRQYENFINSFRILRKAEQELLKLSPQKRDFFSQAFGFGDFAGMQRSLSSMGNQVKNFSEQIAPLNRIFDQVEPPTKFASGLKNIDKEISALRTSIPQLGKALTMTNAELEKFAATGLLGREYIGLRGEDIRKVMKESYAFGKERLALLEELKSTYPTLSPTPFKIYAEGLSGLHKNILSFHKDLLILQEAIKFSDADLRSLGKSGLLGAANIGKTGDAIRKDLVASLDKARGELSALNNISNQSRLALGQVFPTDTFSNAIENINRVRSSLKEQIPRLERLLRLPDEQLEALGRGGVFGAAFAGIAGQNIRREIELSLAHAKNLQKEFAGVRDTFMSKVLIGRNFKEVLKEGLKVMIQTKEESGGLSRTLAGITFRSVYLVGMLGGVFTFVSLIRNAFSTALLGVEDLRKNVAAFAGMTVIFTKSLEGETLRQHFERAHAYARDLYLVMERISAITLLTGEQANLMARAFLQAGVIIDTTSEKQIEALQTIANTIALVTQGQNQNIQVLQEVRALLSGQITPREQLGTLLRAIDPDIKQKIQEWRRLGAEVLLTNLADLLQGMGLASKQIERTWSALFTNLKTTFVIATREGAGIIYDYISGLVQKIIDYFNKNSAMVSRFFESAGEKIVYVLDLAIKFTLKWYDAILLLLGGAGLGLLISFLVQFITSLGALYTSIAKVAMVGGGLLGMFKPLAASKFMFPLTLGVAIISLISLFNDLHTVLTKTTEAINKFSKASSISFSFSHEKIKDITKAYMATVEQDSELASVLKGRREEVILYLIKFDYIVEEGGVLKLKRSLKETKLAADELTEIYKNFGKTMLDISQRSITSLMERIHELKNKMDLLKDKTDAASKNVLSHFKNEYEKLTNIVNILDEMSKIHLEFGLSKEKVIFEKDIAFDERLLSLFEKSDVRSKLSKLTQEQIQEGIRQGILKIDFSKITETIDIPEAQLFDLVVGVRVKPVFGLGLGVTEQDFINFLNKQTAKLETSPKTPEEPPDKKAEKVLNRYITLQKKVLDVLNESFKATEEQIKHLADLRTINAEKTNKLEELQINYISDLTQQAYEEMAIAGEVYYYTRESLARRTYQNEINMLNERYEKEMTLIKAQKDNLQKTIEVQKDNYNELFSLFEKQIKTATGMSGNQVRELVDRIMIEPNKYKEVLKGFISKEKFDVLEGVLAKLIDLRLEIEKNTNRMIELENKSKELSQTLEKDTTVAISKFGQELKKLEFEKFAIRIREIEKEISKFELDMRILDFMIRKSDIIGDTRTKSAIEHERLSLEQKIESLKIESELEKQRKRQTYAMQILRKLNEDYNNAVREGNEELIGQISAKINIQEEELNKINLMIEGYTNLSKVVEEYYTESIRMADLYKKGQEDYIYAIQYALEEWLRRNNDIVAQSSDSINSIISSMENAFMNFFDVTSKGFLNFGSLARAVIVSIYQELLKLLVIKPLTKFIVGGIFGGLFHEGGLVMHQGGVIPRFHLGVDEVPAILQTGERVLSREQNRIFEKLAKTLDSPPQSPQQKEPVQIVNVIDPNLLNQYLSSPAGQRAIVNVISNQSSTIKKVLWR